MPKRILILTCFLALFIVPIWLSHEETRAQVITPQQVDGLWAAVRVVQDSDGVPHVFAQNDHDGNFVMGYLHARDRLFQMDQSRRFFSGTVAEMFGDAAIPQDIQLRTLGLRRAAELSWDVYPPNSQLLLQAYSDGVNAFLARGNPLPPEYAALELTSIPAWSALDSLTVAKGLAFGLSFDSGDTARSLTLAAYLEAGQSGGFDGQALFSEDLFRSAPFDPSLSIPPSQQSSSLRSAGQPSRLSGSMPPQAVELIRQYLGRLRQAGLMDRFNASRRPAGSNWWIVSAQNSATGNALLANDPHLSLDTPSTFYEAHLQVSNDPALGPMNVAGVTFPGVPGFVQGCNDRICWGSTVNPMDVTDFFNEELELGPADDPASGCSLLGLTITVSHYQDSTEEVELIPQTYMFNQVGNGTDDDLTQAFIGPLEGGCTIIVPRHGPVVAVGSPDLIRRTATAITVQHTGFYATREGEAFFRMARARSLQDYREALQFFDFGSQNWGYADVEGNIAYFSSAEMPIRQDLQAGTVDGGIPPFLVRDGTGTLNHEWAPLQIPQPGQAIPFEILPFEEMPQIVNPAQGFIANANNDPVGTTLDNNVLNQLRPGGGIFYLSPGYTSPRIGRIQRLIEGFLNSGDNLIDLDELRSIQQNNQLLDAEVMVPFISQAVTNAEDNDILSAFLTPPLLEAAQRLTDWDSSTPTGIEEGFDPGDDPDNLAAPSQTEIDASVAATIYALWRGQFIRNTIDAALERLGLAGAGPDSERSLSALRHLLDNFDSNQGVGASGVNFFEVEGGLSPQAARDSLILQSLQDALDLLASNEFAPAFGNSSDQDDYRWGRLHRIVFDHPLGGPFSVPNAGGFSDLGAGLPGVARSGGYEAVDASGHSARAEGLNEFMFGSGSARRFVGDLDAEGILAQQIIPGGQSGDLTSPLYASQMGRWLTHQFHPL
ncbi:MAG: penicillin acylase family protein, partial [Acidobacteriota bacterium]